MEHFIVDVGPGENGFNCYVELNFLDEDGSAARFTLDLKPALRFERQLGLRLDQLVPDRRPLAPEPEPPMDQATIDKFNQRLNAVKNVVGHQYDDLLEGITSFLPDGEVLHYSVVWYDADD